MANLPLGSESAATAENTVPASGIGGEHGCRLRCPPAADSLTRERLRPHDLAGRSAHSGSATAEPDARRHSDTAASRPGHCASGNPHVAPDGDALDRRVLPEHREHALVVRHLHRSLTRPEATPSMSNSVTVDRQPGRREAGPGCARGSASARLRSSRRHAPGRRWRR